jgi:hypothetical protein
MDFAETLLTRAKALGSDLIVPAHWLRGDIRRPPLRSGIFVNGAPVLAAFRATDREEREGVVVTISRRLEPEHARMTEKVIVRGPRGNGEYERQQRLYQSDELCSALERTGFTGVQVFASSKCATFEPTASETMWVFCQRGGRLR